MDYENFKEQLVDELKKMASEKDIAVEIGMSKIPKQNGVQKDAISFRYPDGNIGPVHYTDVLFEEYRSGKINMENLAEREIFKAYKEKVEHPKLDMSTYLHPEYLRDHAFFKIMNTEMNPDIARNCAHVDVEDLMLVPYVKIDELSEERSVASVRMTRELQGMSQLTDSELLGICQHNLNRQAPIVSGISEMLLKESGFPPELIQEMMPDGKEPLYVLTSESGMSGATLIASVQARETIKEKIGESDFFVIGSSTEEVLIYPASQLNYGSPEMLRDLCTSINRDESVIQQEQILSNNIYYFNGQDMKICNSLEAYREQKQQYNFSISPEPTVSVKPQRAMGM